MGTSPVRPLLLEVGTAVRHHRTPNRRILYGGVVPALGSEQDVEVALEKSRHVLAELGGLYLASWQAPANRAITIVHDYHRPIRRPDALLRGRAAGAERAVDGDLPRGSGRGRALTRLPVRPTVLIVDDHAEFRQSAGALLEAEGFAVIAEAADGDGG